jgi:hypothetical protein
MQAMHENTYADDLADQDALNNDVREGRSIFGISSYLNKRTCVHIFEGKGLFQRVTHTPVKPIFRTESLQSRQLDQ